jgi:hypothetical protein
MSAERRQGSTVISTLHVNLYAGPGVGKSGIAELLSARLRACGIGVELVREFSKELHWAGTLETTEQFVITAEQYRRQSFMHGKVAVVVSDSAIPLGLFMLRGHIGKLLPTSCTQSLRAGACCMFLSIVIF